MGLVVGGVIMPKPTSGKVLACMVEAGSVSCGVGGKQHSRFAGLGKVFRGSCPHPTGYSELIYPPGTQILDSQH